MPAGDQVIKWKKEFEEALANLENKAVANRVRAAINDMPTFSGKPEEDFSQFSLEVADFANANLLSEEHTARLLPQMLKGEAKSRFRDLDEATRGKFKETMAARSVEHTSEL